MSRIVEKNTGIALVNKLPEALVIAIRALENDIFPYDWGGHQGQCNCGIVVAALTESGHISDSQKLFNTVFREVLPNREDWNQNATWKKVCQKSCSVTGKPLNEVFKALAKQGFLPEDIVHLEYMNNGAILKEAGIETTGDYYKKQDNLIKYLKAWLRIINKKTAREGFNDKNNLEADLLIATAFEDFETANELKLQLSLN